MSLASEMTYPEPISKLAFHWCSMLMLIVSSRRAAFCATFGDNVPESDSCSSCQSEISILHVQIILKSSLVTAS